MALCPVTRKQCQCQPQEGRYCYDPIMAEHQRYEYREIKAAVKTVLHSKWRYVSAQEALTIAKRIYKELKWDDEPQQG